MFTDLAWIARSSTGEGPSTKRAGAGGRRSPEAIRCATPKMGCQGLVDSDRGLRLPHASTLRSSRQYFCRSHSQTVSRKSASCQPSRGPSASQPLVVSLSLSSQSSGLRRNRCWISRSSAFWRYWLCSAACLKAFMMGVLIPWMRDRSWALSTADHAVLTERDGVNECATWDASQRNRHFGDNSLVCVARPALT